MAAAYSASKAAVIGMTKAIGKDLAGTGILVNSIAPAVIETPILEQLSREHVDYMVSRIPLGRLGEPAEVAALIAFLASEELSFATGACFDISGGRATYGWRSASSSRAPSAASAPGPRGSSCARARRSWAS